MSVDKTHSDNNPIMELTPGILKRYHQGMLTAQQMHQVERLLLDDPFAAEALEGIGQMEKPEQFDNTALLLNQKIEQRVKKEKNKVIPLYRRPFNIAAAVLVLVVSGYLLFSYSDIFNPMNVTESPISMNKSDQQDLNDKDKLDQESEETAGLGQNKNQSVTPDSLVGEPIAIAKSNRNELQEVLVKPNASGSQSTPAVPKQEELLVEAEIANEEEVLLDEVNTLADNAAGQEVEKKDENVSDEELIADHAETLDRQPVEADDKDAKKAETRTQRSLAASQPQKKKRQDKGFLDANIIQSSLKGQVIAADNGLGIPGVSLIIKGTTRGVYTDINGLYNINLSPGDSIILFSFVGYETEELNVANKSEVNVDLEPDHMALNEIVIVAYGSEGDDEIVPIIGAAPLGGNGKYKKYLKDSLRYPTEALENKIEGKVKVTFNVDTNGFLTDFNVRRSLGYGCDEEVLRLIKIGPKWQPAKKGDEKIKQKVRVRVKFKLKK